MQLSLNALYWAIVVTAVGMAGCSRNKSAACSDSTECPSGNVCLAERCEQLCNQDEPCPSGFICDIQAVEGPEAGLCLSDARVTPEIISVAGNGVQDCVAETGSACLGSGFIAEGQFTGSTRFTLIGPAEGTSQTEYNLTIASLNATGTTVELAAVLDGLPEPTAGLYSLVASNQSGSSDTQVQLLQGAPGPDLTGEEMIDRINSASSGQIDSSRVDFSSGGGSGGTLYIYSDSPESSGFSTEVGDRMWIRLSANADDSADSVAIDHDRFSNLCGDGDGCSLTLGAEGYVFQGVSRLFRTGGECKFFYSPSTGEWTLDSSCTLWRRLLRVDLNGDLFESTNEDGTPEGFKPYVPSTPAGYDNGADPDPTEVVFGFNYLCYLSEAPVNSARTGLVDDTDSGFHLVIAGDDWSEYPADFFPAGEPNRGCILIVED